MDQHLPQWPHRSRSRTAPHARTGQQSPAAHGRTYAQIFRDNIFTFINIVIFLLGLALVLVGRPSDALVSLGVISANVLVSVVQEIRAKRTLDRIAVLTRPTAQVVRDAVRTMCRRMNWSWATCCKSILAIRSCSMVALSATGRCRWTNRN